MDLVKRVVLGKFFRFGSRVLREESTVIPSHWHIPFHKDSQGVVGNNRPFPIFNSPPTSKLDGYFPNICPPLTDPPRKNVFPAQA